MLSKIQNLLYSCYGENTTDKLPDIRFQLFLTAVKSMMPYEDKIGCYLDLKRYNNEIELLKLYKNGRDDSLESYLKTRKAGEEEDKLMEYKILPAVIANTEWDNIVNEAVKAATFFSVSNTTILDSILLSSAVHDFLREEDAEHDVIVKNAKERLIDFSLKEYSQKNNFELNKRNIIDYERERIKKISTSDIYSEDYIQKFSSLRHIFSMNAEVGEYNDELLSSYSSYLLKLRKGIISPEKLKMPEGRMPELREFLKSQTFSHPLLGKCKIVKRSEEYVVLRNKTGLMKVNI